MEDVIKEDVEEKDYVNELLGSISMGGLLAVVFLLCLVLIF